MDKNYKFDVEALPLNWYYYSFRLKHSAELIIKYSSIEINRFPYLNNSKELNDQYFLNYGFAIENAIKGYLISEDKELTKEYLLSRDISKNHDLVNLVKDIQKIKLTKEDKKLLKDLSDCITFWGRYPIPKKSNGRFNLLQYNEKINIQLNDLFLKFIVPLYENIKNGWKNVNGLNSGTFRDSFFEGNIDPNKIDNINFGNIKI